MYYGKTGAQNLMIWFNYLWGMGGDLLDAKGQPAFNSPQAVAAQRRASLELWITDDGPPRCIALEGEIGSAVRCTIYDRRPGPCRDFAPYAALNIGDEACARARRRHGLAPLGE